MRGTQKSGRGMKQDCRQDWERDAGEINGRTDGDEGSGEGAREGADPQLNTPRLHVGRKSFMLGALVWMCTHILQWISASCLKEVPPWVSLALSPRLTCDTGAGGLCKMV